jgi:glycosyltransferase involved in cell wall biosynthesis
LKIQLAYVVHGFEYGGLERCVANLVNHLDPQEFEPHIVSLTRLGEAQQWVEVPHVQFAELGKSTGNDLGIYKKLSNYLKAKQIHLVHSHNWGTLMEAALACRWRQIPFVHAEHGLDFGRTAQGGKGRVRQSLKRWAMRQSACLIPIAQCVEKRMKEVVGHSHTRIELIRNGIGIPEGLSDASFREEARCRFGIPSGSVVFGTVGRLSHVKGYDIAIEAMKTLVARGSDCHMLLVGDGPEREKLETMITQNGLTRRVHLAGSQKRVGAWLSVMDVFFNSSRSEAMNLSILEAMAAGLPIVAMDVGDNRILVQGPEPLGIAVPSGDVQQFADGLWEIARDLQRRALFAQNGRLAYERHYTLAHMAQRYSRLYHRVIGTMKNS